MPGNMVYHLAPTNASMDDLEAESLDSNFFDQSHHPQDMGI